MPAAVILTYHSLDDSGSPVSTSPQRFRRQIELLRERGFQPITLRELLAIWAGQRVSCERPVVITFDDGLRSVLAHAAPVLAEARCTATLFAVAGRCGRANDWPGQPAWVPRQELLSLRELGELAGAGWEIGSHGMTHADLSRLSVAEVRDEVVGSRQLLEDGLGVEVSAFAYPYGRASEPARSLVAREYRAACSAALGLVRPGQDRFRLRRIDAYYLRGSLRFRLLGTPPGHVYLAARGVGRTLKGFLA